MGEPIRVAMYSDLACPIAYVAHYRWRRLRAEVGDRIAVEHKCLALEYVNREPTPKRVIDAEAPILAAAEPGLPYEPWQAPDSHWPVTLWPAFEAVKCAERQSLALADDLAWTIRRAFFAESACIAMRHVLLELAARAELDMARFTADFDGGIAKRQVIEEARDGWERLRVQGSPTFVFPSGRQVTAPGLPTIEVDPTSATVTRIEPAPCAGDACLDLYRHLFRESLGVVASE
jgi:predicted DsbA family dithiol-disulfide isomerase